MFCTECGTQIDEGKKFCKNCGAKTGGNAEFDATPAAARPEPARKSPGIDKSILIAAGIALFVVLGGAGVYFGTDLLRPSSKQDEVPGRSAATLGYSPPMRENPGESAATAGSPAPMPPASAARPSAPAVASRRSAEAGVYEVVRATTVYEQPSASSRSVASIPPGTRVDVVSSTGSWLEVRSKSGKPPGFIRRGDAVLVDRPG